MIDAKVLSHLRHGCSFHLHGVCLQRYMVPPPMGIGLEELVPRHHRPENDVWLSLENRESSRAASRGRTRPSSSSEGR